MRNRFFTAACAAAAIGLAMPVAAQSTTSTAQPQSQSQQRMNNEDQQMTITGCLERNKSGEFWLTNAQVTNPMSAENRTETGTEAGTTGTTGSTATGTTGTSGTLPQARAGRIFNLEGGDHMDQYVGQQIRVVGNPKDDTSADQLKNTPDNDQQVKARDFDVKSVETVASTCPQR
jgi:hypothetical protein